MSSDGSLRKITPEFLLHAYASGVFPMSEGADDPEIFWVDPETRGILPLDGLHISKSLARRIRREEFEVRINTDFANVVRSCADRDETWINDEIFDLYLSLHQSNFAHSVEVYADDQLVGGLYGVALAGAFFGESMFSTATDASKIALVCLVDRLNIGGFSLLDTQFLTDHLESLGGIEIERVIYRARLEHALGLDADFFAHSPSASTTGVLQRNTQTS